CARQTCAGGICSGRSLVVLAPPVDVAKMLMKTPRRRVIGNPCINQSYCFFSVHLRQNKRAVFVRRNELRVKRGADAQQRRQQMKIDVGEREAFRMGLLEFNEVSANVL